MGDQDLNEDWKHVTTKPCRVSELQSQEKLSTGISMLDELLRGGLPVGKIIEVSGEAGVGKTQLALQALLQVQLPKSEGGLEGSGLFIFTEGGNIPLGRMEGMANASYQKLNKPTDKVFLQRLESVDELLEYLDALEFIMAKQSKFPVKLVVIDSIAACVRSEFDPSIVSLHSRSRKLFSVSSRLRQLGEKFAFAILVTNQVTADMSNTRNEDYGGHAKPALGLIWSQCIDCRLFMEKRANNMRTMRLIYSSWVPKFELPLQISEGGVSSVSL